MWHAEMYIANKTSKTVMSQGSDTVENQVWCQRSGCEYVVTNENSNDKSSDVE